MESTGKAKPKTKAPTVVLKERLDALEKTFEEKVKIIETLSTLVGKVETLEKSLKEINTEGLKLKVLDVEMGVKKELATFSKNLTGYSETLSSFKEDFEKFKKVWGHNEVGVTVNEHFNAQNVEKPMIIGGPPVDEQGNKLPESKLKEQTIGDLKVLTVP